MTGKKFKAMLFFLVMMAFVAFLIMLSSTDYILKEKPTRIYNISVIVSGTNEESWATFKKGLSAAADKWTADISFVTLYDYRGADNQQRGFIQREIDGGADAIILLAADTDNMQQYLQAGPSGVPIIAFGEPIDATQVQSSILYNHEKPIEQLAKAVNQSGASKVVIASSKSESTRLNESKKLFVNLLNSDIKAAVQTLSENENYQQWLKDYNDKTAIVTFEPHILSKLSDAKLSGQNKCLLFGVGNTPNILYGVENGSIDTLAYIDEIKGGYMCIQAAVDVINGRANGGGVLPVYSINNKNMFNGEYEKILFPV